LFLSFTLAAPDLVRKGDTRTFQLLGRQNPHFGVPERQESSAQRTKFYRRIGLNIKRLSLHEGSAGGEKSMLGWMILFALMSVLGAIMMFTNPTMAWVLLELMFALLFLVGLLTRLVRGRVW
jgi:hypothetical protein